MTVSTQALRALGRLRASAGYGDRTRLGFSELAAAGLIERDDDSVRFRWTITDAGRSYPVADVAGFADALAVIEATDEDLDRARRARNEAAARLVERLSLAELAEIAGVSRERVRQWAKEGKEG